MTVYDTHDVQRAFAALSLPFRFSADEHSRLITTDIVIESPRVIAFPTPASNIGLNILNLRRLLGVDPSKQPAFFDHPWYLNEPFAGEDCTPGWHFLQMSVLADSISQPLNYSGSLASRGLELPSAVEVVLMVFLHFIGTGEQLLQKKHTWCRDEATLGRFVTVGAFGRNGLFLSAHPEVYSSRGLGICAKVSY